MARFPDMGEEETLLSTDKENYLPTEILMPPAPGQSILKFPAVKDFPKDAFVGGIYSGMHGRNSFTASTGLIKEVNDDILTIHAFFSRQWDKQSYTRMGKGSGYIINCFAALTSPMEWYWSENDKSLCFIPPRDFNSQTDQIEVRHRLWGLDLRERKNIVVEGLHFKAASIRMDDAFGCEVRRCEVLYPSPWTAYKATDYGGRVDASCGVYVSGKENRLWRNRIAHSWGAGAFVDQEIPGLRAGRAGSRRSQFLALDDRKDYSVDELKEIFPPLDRARWEREKREQAKRLEEGEKKRIERQRAKERE